MLLYNAQLYTMSEGILSGGWISFENGMITGLGEADTCPAISGGDIDAGGAPVTPGLVDAHCHLGLFEDSQHFDTTDDCNEWTASITPHLRALDAVNPLDRMFGEAVSGGVTTVCTSPGSANPIAGQMLVMKTFGRRVDDMTVLAPAALKMAFGENVRKHGAKNNMPCTRMGAAALIREAFLSALAYRDNPDRAFDMKLDSLLPVLAGELPVHAHAHRAHDIFSALRIGAEFGFEVIIVHGTEAPLVADLLEGVQIITGPAFGTRDKPELYHKTLDGAAVLSSAGLKPCICTDAPVLPIESLPLLAGLAVKEGMLSYEALRAITLYPAAVLKLGHRLGALRPGMDADVVLWNVHPLLTNAAPTGVWINGQRRA